MNCRLARWKRPRAALVALLAVAGAWLTAPATPAVAAPGELTYDGCLADTAERGCVDLPAAPLNGPNGIAVSADGTSVYVASYDGDSIAHLFRNGPDGQLGWDVRKRKLVLRLSAAVQDPAGNRRTVRRQVSPRLKARRRS